MPAWVTTATEQYRKRLPRELGFDVCSVAISRRSSNKSVAVYQQQEARALRQAASKASRLIALDVNGTAITTSKLVQKLRQWQLHGDNVAIFIGGPDGLAATLLSDCHECWSLSGLTLPHPLVRVVLAEQLYRAWTVIIGHPYHK